MLYFRLKEIILLSGGFNKLRSLVSYYGKHELDQINNKELLIQLWMLSFPWGIEFL